MNKKIVVSVLLLGIAISTLGLVGFSQWRGYVKEKQAFTLFAEIKSLAEQEEKHAALNYLIEERPVPMPQELEIEWDALELQIATELRNARRLEVLYQKKPELVLADETTALLWARLLMHMNKHGTFEHIRSHWEGNETKVEEWHFLDVDFLIGEGERQEAESKLNALQFEGYYEQQRLVYLSLFQSHQPQKSLELLSKAYAIDPKNTEVRTFCANLYEAIGRTDIALREYTAAHAIAPENPNLKNNLAEFYRRQGNLTQAIRTWNINADDGLFDFVWLKSYFWQRVFQGLPSGLPTMKNSPFNELSQSLAKLAPSTYWNEETENAYSQIQPLVTEKGIYWLRLLQQLKKQDYENVLKALQYDTYESNSYANDLAHCLSLILQYRLNNRLYTDIPFSPKTTEKKLHPFLQKLYALETKGVDQHGTISATDEAFLRFLQTPEALSAAFITAGWMQIAIDFKPESPSSNTPNWYAYGMAQSLRYCGRIQESITFIQSQKHTPALTTLLGELYLATNQPNEALRFWNKIYTHNSGAGQRAAWLLTLAYLEKNSPEKAEAVLKKQPRLSNSIQGKELAARIALAQGKRPEAKTIYSGISQNSLEAKVFFARNAFNQKDWAIAQQWTEEALTIAPNSPTLHHNLQLIQEAHE